VSQVQSLAKNRRDGHELNRKNNPRKKPLIGVFKGLDEMSKFELYMLILEFKIEKYEKRHEGINVYEKVTSKQGQESLTQIIG